MRRLVALVALIGVPACSPRVVEPGGGAAEHAHSRTPPLAERCRPKVGSRAPELSLRSLNGNAPMRIEPGTVTFVYFWATWEAPSKHAFPRFEETSRRLGTRGYRILAISVDDEGERVAEAGTSWGATFPLGWDQGHRIAECWGPESEPEGFLVDKAGVVRAIHPGYHDGEATVIESEAEALLAESPK